MTSKDDDWRDPRPTAEAYKSPYRERWQALREAITRAPAQAFDMSDWLTQETDSKVTNLAGDLLFKDVSVDITDCGTAGCLAGWAYLLKAVDGDVDKVFGPVQLEKGHSLSWEAAVWLGLTDAGGGDTDADAVFTGDWLPASVPMSKATPADALILIDAVLAEAAKPERKRRHITDVCGEVHDRIEAQRAGDEYDEQKETV